MPNEQLKKDLWKKVFCNESIVKHNHYYRDICYAIKEQTGFLLSKDTIRNLIEDRNKPSPRTLDIYATFLLGGSQGNPFTFQDYLERCQQRETNVAENQTPSGALSDDQGKKKLVFILLPVCFTILAAVLFSMQPKKSEKHIWLEEFHTNSPAELQHRGWEIIDFDSTYWNQIRDGSLTLFTQYGDYSSNLIDSTVHNFVYRKLDCTHCEITVKIEDFNPYNRYQQAAIYLLDSNLNRSNNIRFSFAVLGPDTVYEHRTKTHRVHNNRGIQIFNQVNGRTVHFTEQLRVQIYDKGELPLAEKEIRLKIKITPGHYQTAYIINDSIEGFTSFEKGNLHFSPAYIGLACLGNGVKASTYPSSGDDIPAYFDYVMVEGCDR
ncbi:hypothetical protein [Phaeodactylibacter xiamenensis]|jgi:hypothetical protein|uniref:hypothetical protein n=1 Tax=Phaeodactylibacter xiamenensis TaxID=1524460 RepID=UPI0024A9ECD5|nr:hypothetical protein [Phaeodactylibacter xiamenensis]